MYYKLTLFLFVHRWRWSWIGPRSWWLWLRGLQSWWWRRQQQLSLLYYCFLLYFYQCPIMNLYVWYLWQLNSICGYALMLLKFRYINFVFFIFQNIHSWVLILCPLMEISKNLVLVESGRILDSTTRLYDTILPEHFRSDSESRFWQPWYEDSWGVVCKSQLLNVSKLGLNGLLHVLLLATEALISIDCWL
jgi:hypothetical protein